MESLQMSWLDNQVEKLSPGFPEHMVLLDCETTGGKSTYHRISEIGLLQVDHGQVTRRWQSLVNPQQSLSPAIQKLTGITPMMLRDAPLFEDIATELQSLLEDRVLVAHNVRFDHGFLKQEFSRAGTSYRTLQLCSVKLSRVLFPQFRRHGLDHLIRRFGFTLEQRHRAMDDAQVIWQFLLKLSELFDEEEVAATCQQLMHRPALPSQLDATQVEQLPRTPGVYYFFDQQQRPLYIGKSVNIYHRVMSHFSQDYRNPKDLKMHDQIAQIDFEETASDFSAQLLESQQIKQLKPVYNRRLKKAVRLYHFSIQTDSDGYLRIQIESCEKQRPADTQYGLFRHPRQAHRVLERLADEHMLCHRLVGLEARPGKGNTPCFRFQLHRCLGACCAQEAAEQYNQRVMDALRNYRAKAWPWQHAVMLEESNFSSRADADGKHYHLLDQWRYLGRIYSHDDLYEAGYRVNKANTQINITEQNASDQMPTLAEADFDLDTYFILVSYLLKPPRHPVTIIPLEPVNNDIGQG